MSRAGHLLLIAIVLILGGDAAGLATIHATATAAYPSKWDPRLAPLASFVEDARHLRFKHPVTVRFLSEAQYLKEASNGDAADLSDADRKGVDNFTMEMRALGLATKQTDVFGDQNTLATDGTVAYYDSYAKEMVIRGQKFDVDARVTAVHELTHALQDQNFDISRGFDTDGANALFQALTEGDATRIENEYVDDLSNADADIYFGNGDSSSDASDSAGLDVTPALLQFSDAPYTLGGPMTTAIVQAEGVAALDALFRHPPDSDEGLLNVFALLNNDSPKKVTKPKLAADEKKFDSGDFGAVAWYIVLSSFIDPRVALTAVDGWGGDSYVAFTKNGQPCMRIAFVGDTPSDTTEMATAATQWGAKVSATRVTVITVGDRVEFSSCEPDPSPKPVPTSENSLDLPASRFDLVSSVLASHAPLPFAQCASREFVLRADPTKLNPQTEAEAKALLALGTQIGQACRGAVAV